jgi:hypothetical protein
MSLEIDFWDPAPAGALTTANGIPTPLLYGEGPDYIKSSRYDMLVLGNHAVPGKCTLRGSVELAVDEKKASGVDGAALTINGIRPARMDATIEIWTQRQWELFLKLVPRIWRKPNKRLKGKAIVDFGMALDLNHPYAALWGITSVVVTGAGFPEPAGTRGAMQIPLHMRQFILPGKKVTATVKQSGVEFDEDPRLPPAKNQGGKPPHETDVGPTGPKPDRTPGSH